MRILRNLGLVAALALAAAWPAASQMGVPLPDFRGVFSPTVGAGAAYQMQGKSGQQDIEITVVGKEDVNGKPGFWIEMAMNPSGKGQMYAKTLMVLDGKNSTIARMIFQMPGQAPMELPAMMMSRGGQTPAPTTTDIRDQAEHVGTEDVTTPAGTFSCEHYRSKDGGDVWISSKVTPWGLVKSSSNGQSMTLIRVISDAQDHITGTPQKFDPSQLMRGRGGQPPQ
jgi:hypothetical protein